MENLYERAVQIQSQLTPANQYEEHLIEVLRVAIQEQPFYTFVKTAKPTASARAYMQECLHSIEKQEYCAVLKRTG